MVGAVDPGLEKRLLFNRLHVATPMHRRLLHARAVLEGKNWAHADDFIKEWWDDFDEQNTGTVTTMLELDGDVHVLGKGNTVVDRVARRRGHFAFAPDVDGENQLRHATPARAHAHAGTHADHLDLRRRRRDGTAPGNRNEGSSKGIFETTSLRDATRDAAAHQQVADFLRDKQNIRVVCHVESGGGARSDGGTRSTTVTINCGAGTQSIKWLALAAAQRVSQRVRGRGRRRQREPRRTYAHTRSDVYINGRPSTAAVEP